jgi:predicted NUDIX family NTP pyrophosphohydrolase
LPVHSAGILLYRGHGCGREVFLVHPGGPLWTKRDEGAWSIPKGVLDPNEDSLAAARREFKEETGFEVGGEFHDLGIFRQPSGKLLPILAVEGDCASNLVSIHLRWCGRRNLVGWKASQRSIAVPGCSVWTR